MADIGLGRARHASKITRLREPRHQKREKFGIVGVGSGTLQQKLKPPATFFSRKKCCCGSRCPTPFRSLGRRSVAKIVPFVLQLSLQRITEGSPTTTGRLGEGGNSTLSLCSNPIIGHPVDASSASVRCNKVVTALSDQIRTALKIPLSIKISGTVLPSDGSESNFF